jgi:hypothetical protein
MEDPAKSRVKFFNRGISDYWRGYRMEDAPFLEFSDSDKQHWLEGWLKAFKLDKQRY